MGESDRVYQSEPEKEPEKEPERARESVSESERAWFRLQVPCSQLIMHDNGREIGSQQTVNGHKID